MCSVQNTHRTWYYSPREECWTWFVTKKHRNPDTGRGYLRILFTSASPELIAARLRTRCFSSSMRSTRRIKHPRNCAYCFETVARFPHPPPPCVFPSVQTHTRYPLTGIAFILASTPRFSLSDFAAHCPPPWRARTRGGGGGGSSSYFHIAFRLIFARLECQCTHIIHAEKCEVPKRQEKKKTK